MDSREIESRFGFHKATLEGPHATAQIHADLREAYKDFAHKLDQALPEGRYKSLAMTELENAAMWSHKSVAEKAPLE